MKYNLHTHSFYCKHGKGEIREYAEYAESRGFELLGFSEHCPFPGNCLHASTRMDYREMDSYFADIDRAAEEFSSIEILRGFECDYYPEFHDYFAEIREKTDYLITGTHFMRDGERISNPFDGPLSKKDLFIYANSTFKAMETGLFSFVCHPDVFLLQYPFDKDAEAVSRDIISLSIELGLPLEVNANGIYKALSAGQEEYGYPNRSFWNLAKDMGAKCVRSSDAHLVENLDRNDDRLSAFISEHSLDMVTPSVVHKDGRKIICFT